MTDQIDIWTSYLLLQIKLDLLVARFWEKPHRFKITELTATGLDVLAKLSISSIEYMAPGKSGKHYQQQVPWFTHRL